MLGLFWVLHCRCSMFYFLFFSKFREGAKKALFQTRFPQLCHRWKTQTRCLKVRILVKNKSGNNATYRQVKKLLVIIGLRSVQSRQMKKQVKLMFQLSPNCWDYRAVQYKYTNKIKWRKNAYCIKWKKRIKIERKWEEKSGMLRSL